MRDALARHGLGRRNERRDSALAMIGLGGLFLLLNAFDRVWLALPVIGVAFLVAGIVTRQAGLLIPGGIMGGISLGIFLIEGPFTLVSEDDKGGLFMLAFAAGWFSIALLSLLTPERQWWALIPGGVMALIGLAALGGGIWGSLLRVLGFGWPVVLIAIGVYSLLRHRRESSDGSL